jgi:hypothetical protein
MLAALVLMDNRSLDILASRSVIDMVLFLGVVLALCSITPDPDVMKAFGFIGAIVAGYSLGFGLLAPGKAMLPMGSSAIDNKAVIGHSLLSGPMSHSNSLGILLALALPFIGLWHSPFKRLLAYIIIFTALLWTGSRTSLLAVSCVFLLMIAWRILRVRSAVLGGCTIAGLAALIVILPFAVNNPLSLSGRGAVWRGSLDALVNHGSLLFGLGPYWGGLRPSSNYRGAGSDTTSGHNLFVQWLVTGGLIQVSIGIVIMFLVARRALDLDAGRSFPVFTAYVVVFLTVSITEFIAIFSVSSQLFALAAMPLAAMLACERNSTDNFRREDDNAVVRSVAASGSAHY